MILEIEYDKKDKEPEVNRIDHKAWKISFEKKENKLVMFLFDINKVAERKTNPNWEKEMLVFPYLYLNLKWEFDKKTNYLVINANNNQTWKYLLSKSEDNIITLKKIKR